MRPSYVGQGDREVAHRLRQFTGIEMEENIPYRHSFSPCVYARRLNREGFDCSNLVLETMT